MNTETIEIEKLSNDPANVRTHSARNIAVVVASLRRFGQQIPLVVDNNNIVRVGNARLEAMRQLGWETGTIVRTSLSGSELVAYAIADNRSGDPDVGSAFDAQALAEVLSALAAEDKELAGAAGYSLDELASLISSSNETPPEPPADFEEFNEAIDTEHACPKCGYRWSGSSAAKGGT